MSYNAPPISVVPSLPAASFEEIVSLCDALEDIAPEIQIDIVDGEYVPLRSWPFVEKEAGVKSELLRLQPYAEKFLLEMDCMVLNPEQYLDTFVEIGVHRVAVHIGSTQKYAHIIKHANDNAYELGFALTNDTPLDIVHKYIDDISYVQLMGIKEVGQQGQPFDSRTLQRARQLRTCYPELEIAVDGSVNEKTMPLLFAAGVTRFAPGSAIAKTDDPASSYKHLVSLVT